MKYITRQLYQSMQGLAEDKVDEFQAKWRRACDDYQALLSQIKPELCPAMRDFAEKTFHDGVVRSVEQPEQSVLILEIDAARNP